MSYMSVAQASEHLGVDASRVRQLIADGRLSADKVGRAWIVNAASVEAVRREKRSAGRPYSPSKAWGLIALAEQRHPGWLADAEIDHLTGVLEAEGLASMAGKLKQRAARHGWYVHPSMLQGLVDDPRTVVGGAAASGILADSELSEVYIAPDDEHDLAGDYHADTEASEPNVIVRVVQGPWPFLPAQRVVGPVVAGLDLADLPMDDRRERAAAEILGRA